MHRRDLLGCSLLDLVDFKQFTVQIKKNRFWVLPDIKSKKLFKPICSYFFFESAYLKNSELSSFKISGW